MKHLPLAKVGYVALLSLCRPIYAGDAPLITISAPQDNWVALYRNEEAAFRQKFSQKLVAIHHVPCVSRERSSLLFES